MSVETKSTTMSLYDAIHTRRSVRGFLDKPVPQEVLDEVFALAQQTPSNCNIQPWKVFVASGDTRNRMRETMLTNITSGVAPNQDYEYPGKFEGEYRTRQVDCAVEMYSTMGIGREDKEGRMRASLRNFELFDAPHVAFIGMDKAFGATVALDVGMYIQSLMLALTAHGIGSCAQGSMRSYPDLVRETFPGNENTHILVGLSFGYEDSDVPANNTRIGREDVSASVTFKN
jgi:nitroreductase